MEAIVDPMDRISQLPEPIIHRILTRLHVKDAAQTSVLSRTWRCIWASGPNLEFTQCYFRARDGKLPCTAEEIRQTYRVKKEKFLKFINDSMRSRLEQKLSVEKFKLSITCYDLELAPHIDRCIDFAIKSNVKKLFIEVWEGKDMCYNLPQTVLAAKTITILRLHGCKLETNFSEIKLSCLQKVSLKYIHVDEQMIQNLLSNCPLIEDLILRACSGLINLQILGLLKINKVEVFQCREVKSVEIGVPNLQTFIYDGVRGAMPCKINLNACKTLIVLTLEDAIMTDKMLQDQIFKSPVLEKLELYNCHISETIKISNPRLKRLALRKCVNLEKAEIDTPNLLSFQIESLHEAKLSFDPEQKAKLEFYLGDHDTLLYAKPPEYTNGLKLVIQSDKSVIIHKELKEILLPPLHDLKLDIINPSTSFEDLINRLLSKHPKTVSIVSYSGSKFLKLMHEKIMGREEDQIAEII